MLSPSCRTLEKKLQRSHYVTVLWSHANTSSPDQDLCPTDYGWEVDGGLLQPAWFDGTAVPDALFCSDDGVNIESYSGNEKATIPTQSGEVAIETDDLDKQGDYDWCEYELRSEDSDTQEMK